MEDAEIRKDWSVSTDQVVLVKDQILDFQFEYINRYVLITDSNYILKNN